MTITVIGHLCVDEIHFPHKTGDEERSREGFGGIFFSLATLASLSGPNDTIYPVFGVGEKEYDALRNVLEKFTNVDTTGVFKIKGNTNRVHFFYEEGRNSRTECSNHISEPIPFAKIKPHLDSDGILINMVSGFDITLETMDAIRMAIRDARTPTHFDFHSLTLGIDQNSKRFRRPMTDWRRWCFMLNSIQMTQDEALGLTAEQYDESTLVNQLMPLMVNALVVTRGERGTTVIVQENKKLTRNDYAAASFGPTIDTIGCGDVFGAAFFHHFLRNKDYARAAEFANRAGGLKATFAGIDGMSMLSEKLNSVSAAH
jgi:sugar/nucleoside kinase (ribokinase family)